MTPAGCSHEDDVMALVLSGRWPHGADEELCAHAESCATCRDVAAITSLLRSDRLAAADTPIPAAGQVWWRAAIRARADAARAATRPMVWLQAGLGAAAAGLIAASVSLAWPRLTTMWGLPFGGSLQETMPLLLAIGAGVIAAPIAFYLAVPRD